MQKLRARFTAYLDFPKIFRKLYRPSIVLFNDSTRNQRDNKHSGIRNSRTKPYGEMFALNKNAHFFSNMGNIILYLKQIKLYCIFVQARFLWGKFQSVHKHLITLIKTYILLFQIFKNFTKKHFLNIMHYTVNSLLKEQFELIKQNMKLQFFKELVILWFEVYSIF